MANNQSQQKDHQQPVWPLAHTESTRWASGNARKWIHFLPVEGHEILINTSFLTLSNSLAACACVHVQVCVFMYSM